MKNETLSEVGIGEREERGGENPCGRAEEPQELRAMLNASAARHHHLCPRQVLGVRIGLAGARAVGMEVPRQDKRLLVIVETDGCFISGVEAATGCSVYWRTMRILDYGKIAAVFVNVITGQTVRVAPRLDARERVWAFAPAGETRHYFAMLYGYQAMPDDHLLTCSPGELQIPLSEIISRPGVRENCARCGEEIINEREIMWEGKPLCRGCAGTMHDLFGERKPIPGAPHPFRPS